MGLLASSLFAKSVSPHKDQHIEFLRFVAALAVVCVHMPVLGWGNWGVDVFFVISGFVMMLSTAKNADNFLLKRIIRIVPTYYLFTLILFALAVAFPLVLKNTSASGSELVKSLLFIPFNKNGTGFYPVLFLGWTLNYEMFFYATFAIALKVNREHRGLLASIGIFAATYACRFGESEACEFYSRSIAMEFVLGILLFEILHTKNLVRSICLVCLFFLPLLSHGYDFQDRCYEVGLLSFLACLVVLKSSKHWRIPPAVVLLGEGSYALYLSHPYIIQAFDKMGWFAGSWVSSMFATMLVFAITLAFACFFYLLVEKPMSRALRAKLL